MDLRGFYGIMDNICPMCGHDSTNDDDFAVTEFKTVQRKARKDHICFVCNKTIEKGQIYNLESGRCDGEFYNIKRHLGCHQREF